MLVSGRGRLVLSGGFLALFIYDGVLRTLLAGLVTLPAIPGGLNSLTVLLLLFSLSHASYALGGRLTLAFFGITAVTSWILEEVGVATGLVFGPYHYTSTLGPWLGSVPVLIPLAWFMMIYPSYVLANLIIDGRPTGSPGGRGHLVGLALLGALVMTAWDLVVDPILSGTAFGAWVWEEGGPYFGIPIHNYLGWIATTFIVYVLYRGVEHRWVPRPAGSLTLGASSLPILAYAAMMVSNLLSGGTPAALAVIAPIAMGMPVVAGFIRLVSAGDAAAPPAPNP
jgi:uncharacterized membrane protein